MGASISRISTTHYDGENGSAEPRDRSCIQDGSKCDAIVEGIDDQESHPEPYGNADGHNNRLITTMGHLPASTLCQIRRVAYYFLSRWQRLFYIFRSWSAEGIFQMFTAKFSCHEEDVLERLEAGQGMLKDKPIPHDNPSVGVGGSSEKILAQVSSENGVTMQTNGSYESNNQGTSSRPKDKLKDAAFEKNHLQQALDKAHNALNDMKSTHIRDQDEIQHLRHLIHVVTEFQQSFSNDVTSIKNQTNQMIDEYDEQLVATSAVRDLAFRKLKEAENKVKSLNSSITAKDASLSKAAGREHSLEKRIGDLELKLKDALDTYKQRVLPTNDEAKSKASTQADKPRLGSLPSAADNILHSLYNDALNRSAILEAENLSLRESLTTAATTSSHGTGRKSQQRQSPAVPIKTAPTELIVIGVDIGRGVNNHLFSIKTVYRTILHYISLNNSLALVSTVAHGCRGSHNVFVGPLDRPHLLALDTLKNLPPGGTPSYERCLASAHNVLASDKALFASCRKVVVLVGHAMDQAPTKSFKGLCHRFKGDGVEVHSVVVGSVAKADEGNLGINWVAERVGGRSLSENSYLGALPEIIRHDG